MEVMYGSPYRYFSQLCTVYVSILLLWLPQWKGREAVSYTHLDVYKRQVMDNEIQE